MPGPVCPLLWRYPPLPGRPLLYLNITTMAVVRWGPGRNMGRLVPGDQTPLLLSPSAFCCVSQCRPRAVPGMSGPVWSGSYVVGEHRGLVLMFWERLVRAPAGAGSRVSGGVCIWRNSSLGLGGSFAIAV